jgi:hypothetical protein
MRHHYISVAFFLFLFLLVWCDFKAPIHYVLITKSEAVFDLTIERFKDGFHCATVYIEQEEDSVYKSFTANFRPEYKDSVQRFILETWGPDTECK